MQNITDLLLSKEILIVYIILGIAILLCLLIYIIDKITYKSKLKKNTLELIDLVKATTYEDDNQKRLLAETQNSGNSTAVQNVGYSIQVIDENNVVVRLAIRVPQYSALAQSTFTLIWDKGDWKIKLGPDEPLDITIISSVENAGMVPWVN